MAGNMTNIGGRLHDTSGNHIVAGANEIFDDDLGKRQSEFNAEQVTINQNQDAINQNQESINDSVDESIENLEEQVADRYTKEETNNLISRTPETDVIVIDVPSESQSDIAGWLDANTPSGTDPETGRSVRANKLYRVPGPTNTTYSEWGWNGTAYIMLDNKDYGIDDEPTPDSNNFVKSGGVYESIRENLLFANRGFYIDKNHVLEKVGDVRRYVNYEGWNAIWIDINFDFRYEIKITGCTLITYQFYSSYQISSATFLGSNTTGRIPNGAVVCIANTKEVDNPGGYDDVHLEISRNLDDAIKLSHEITRYAITKSCIDQNGRWLDTYNHGTIPVQEGQIFFIENFNSIYNNIRYAFMSTSAVGTTGTDIIPVSGTTIHIVAHGTIDFVKIPSGCNFLIFNAGNTDYNVRVYEYVSTEILDNVVPSVNNPVKSEAIFRDLKSASVYTEIEPSEIITSAGGGKTYLGYVQNEIQVGDIIENAGTSSEKWKLYKYNVEKGDVYNVMATFDSSKNVEGMYIYYWADENGRFIYHEPIRPSRSASIWSWDEYITPPDGAKLLYVMTSVSVESTYITRKSEISPLGKNDIADNYDGGEGKVLSANRGKEIYQHMSYNVPLVVDGIITSDSGGKTYLGDVQDTIQIGDSIEDAGTSSAKWNLYRYEIVAGHSYKVSGYFPPSSNVYGVYFYYWTDENKCFISRENIKTVKSAGIWSWNEEIVAPSGAKYLYVETRVQYKGNYETSKNDFITLEYLAEQLSSMMSVKKKLKILSIGNSYSQDALAYVPYILQNMGVPIDIQIGILMMSSGTLQNHYENFTNETAAYTFYLHEGGESWSNLGSKTIQNVLDNYEWDVITLQQSSQGAYNWGTYQPWANLLINSVSAYVTYSMKWAWFQPWARPASRNSGGNWSDDVITEHYESTALASERLMNESVFEALIPCGTAIQNARSISALKALGEYANNPLNTSGLGYLSPNDGVHLEEGLPCQIAAYTFVLAILDIYGYTEYSINGESLRFTAEWAVGKAIPSPHGSYIGSDDANSLIAQKCAVMAMKKPFEVTDMNYIIYPE